MAALRDITSSGVEYPQIRKAANFIGGPVGEGRPREGVVSHSKQFICQMTRYNPQRDSPARRRHPHVPRYSPSEFAPKSDIRRLLGGAGAAVAADDGEGHRGVEMMGKGDADGHDQVRRTNPSNDARKYASERRPR